MALLLAGVLALAATTSDALAEHVAPKPSDVSATRLYLIAKHRLLEQAVGLAATEQAIHGLVAQVSTQCQGVLAQAPENKATSDIRFEVLIDVALTLEQPERNATVAFAKIVERLHWSSRKLTYFVHGSAAEARANAEIPLTNICSDATAVAAGGFQAVPPATSTLLRESEAANSKVDIVAQSPEHPPGDLDEKIMQLLKPYERSGERALIPPVSDRHQKELGEAYELKLFLSPAVEIVHLLGLHTVDAKSVTPPAASGPATAP